MKIIVKDAIGSFCTEYEQGERLLDLTRQGLEDNGEVDVDFEGVQLATSAFFNASFGVLYGDYPLDVLKAKIKVSHLSKEMRQVMSRSLEAAKKFYEERRPA